MGVLQAVDHLLLAALEVVAVLELVAQVRQPEQALAPRHLQARHAGQGDFQGGGDLALHLLRGGPGVLGDDLDDRRRGVRVGLDVDVLEGEAADAREADGQQQDDEGVIDRPLDEAADHEARPGVRDL